MLRGAKWSGSAPSHDKVEAAVRSLQVGSPAERRGSSLGMSGGLGLVDLLLNTVAPAAGTRVLILVKKCNFCKNVWALCV